MDVVSAALLKEAQKFSRCTRGVYICDRDGFQLSMWCYGCLLRNVLAALASRPAPATDSAALLKRLRFDFIDGLDGADLSEDDQRIVKECLDQAIANYVKALASLPAPAAPERTYTQRELVEACQVAFADAVSACRQGYVSMDVHAPIPARVESRSS